MDCRFFREQVVLESYDELDAEGKKSLEAHLRICGDCKQFQVSLNETQQALDQWPEVDRPMDIEALHGAVQPKPFMSGTNYLHGLMARSWTVGL